MLRFRSIRPVLFTLVSGTDGGVGPVGRFRRLSGAGGLETRDEGRETGTEGVARKLKPPRPPTWSPGNSDWRTGKPSQSVALDYSPHGESNRLICSIKWALRDAAPGTGAVGIAASRILELADPAAAFTSLLLDSATNGFMGRQHGGSPADSPQYLKAIELFDAVVGGGIVTPNAYHYSCLMSIAVRFGAFKDAIKTFDGLRQRGIVPTAATCTAAIAAHGMARDRHGVDEVISLTRWADVERDGAFYAAAIHAYCRAGCWEPALNVMGEMNDSGFQADVICYNMVIHGAARGGRLDIMMRIFDAMSPTVQPDTVTYNSVLGSLTRNKHHEEALQIWGRMQAARPRVLPDALTLRAVSVALADLRRFSDLTELRERAAREGWSPRR